MERSKAARRIVAACILTLFAGCAGKRAPLAGPAPKGYVEKGVASWYGKKFHGRTTASGETYDMHQLTAAHRTLPFGAVVRVVNLRNGLSVKVRINDRGPFKKGRIIDLSYAAARKLNMIGPGVVPVRIVVLDP